MTFYCPFGIGRSNNLSKWLSLVPYSYRKLSGPISQLFTLRLSLFQVGTPRYREGGIQSYREQEFRDTEKGMSSEIQVRKDSEIPTTYVGKDRNSEIPTPYVGKDRNSEIPTPYAGKDRNSEIPTHYVGKDRNSESSVSYNTTCIQS